MMTDGVSSTMRTPTHRTAAAMKGKAKSTEYRTRQSSLQVTIPHREFQQRDHKHKHTRAQNGLSKNCLKKFHV